MKRKRSKVILIAGLLALGLFWGGGMAYLASAEETTETLAETTTSDIPDEEPVPAKEAEKTTFLGFDLDEETKELVQPFISGFAGLAGAALLYLSFSGHMGKLKSAFDGIVSWFQKKGEELVGDEIDIKKLQEGLKKAIESNTELKTALEALKGSQAETYEKVMAAVNSLVQSYEAREEEMLREYKQIKGVLIKLLAGNPSLVRSGIADEMIKELEENIKEG